MSDKYVRDISPRELGLRLQEVRKSRKLTQQEAAEFLGIARTTIVAMEKGERAVQAGELMKLASLYGRPVSYFKRPGPTLEAFTVQFRAVLKEEDGAVNDALDAFRSCCDNYLYLEQLCDMVRDRTGISPYETKGLSPESAGESVARRERSRLGLGDAPVGDFRSLLEEEIGMMVFYLDLPSSVSGMFAYTEAHGGCIAVNRRQPPERTLWSLAHEYGHYLTNRYQADIVTTEEMPGLSPHERTADSFAKHLLLPAGAVNRRFDAIVQQGDGKVTPADLLSMAAYFGVSFKALTLRLEEMKRLPSGTWQRLTNKGFKVREAQELLGMSITKEAEQFPKRYRLLAALAYAKGHLTEGRLAEILRLDRLAAREELSRILQEVGVENLEDLSALLTGADR